MMHIVSIKSLIHCSLKLVKSIRQYSSGIRMPRSTGISSLTGVRRYSATNQNYETAVATLNTLQPNAMTVQKSIKNLHNSGSNHLKDTEKYLLRSGLTFADLDTLSVIHVSGTKGKGSTCSMIDSILKSHGLKTGFYSSPHLTSVTERIRISSEPISETDFTNYFWKVYNSMRTVPEDFPPYFKFLTILALHVFISEKVDVSILEVGIGGRFDCTNIVRNTKTVGITSLDLEHTNLLGDTMHDIAWQKSGIIKERSNVFTVPQLDICLNVINEKCAETNSKLFIVPPFESYKWEKELTNSSEIFKANTSQQLNASLAIQLSKDWLSQNSCKLKKGIQLSANRETVGELFAEGIDKWFWPGRYQKVIHKNKNVYLDGAHTIASITMCINWFKNCTQENENKKILIFNVTGGRDYVTMMNVLKENSRFTEAFFVPSVSCRTGSAVDNTFYNYSATDQIQHCEKLAHAWKEIQSPSQNTSYVLPCVSDVFSFLDKQHKDIPIDILVTGTLHLVGAALKTLENEL